tara:strand:- start:2006 stop:2230 length:225 start_codon:yes stop_codon:yes gene_type:complete
MIIYPTFVGLTITPPGFRNTFNALGSFSPFHSTYRSLSVISYTVFKTDFHFLVVQDPLGNSKWEIGLKILLKPN